MSAGPAEVLNIATVFLEDRLAEGCGDRPALHTTDRSWTYAEVAERSRRFAALLRARGVRPEERVLLALEDGIDMVAGIFGTLELGAVAVMVNPDLDADAYRYFCHYTRARAVLSTGPALEAGLRREAEDGRHCLAVIALDEAETAAELERIAPLDEPFPTHPDDAAIWLFSGGTTGRPKAVVQSHRSFLNTTRLYGQNVLGLTADDVTLSVPKLFFGYATGSNLFFPFSVGGAAVLFPERCTADRLFDLIERFRPTVLVNVPTMIGKLLDAGDADRRDLSSLRLCTSAGEALPEALQQRWMERFGTEILDGLGTAEMWHVFLTNHPGDVRPGTLGRPVQGFEVRVRDDEGRDLPDGEVGWLWVRGDSRAHGYWQRRERTRQTFRGEWVVTGDMVRRDDDGVFTYCGRGDDMIKVSGKWLSPGEVENCLLRHAGVAEAAVIAVDDDAGLAKPWAFVLAASGRAPSPEELRAFALEHLEPYKAPRVVRVVDELPRTHLGKVDRSALRALARG